MATRIITSTGSVVYYLHADHLGSASLTTNVSGNKLGELRYSPYGVTRYVWGNTPTDRRFTGQRSEEASLGSLYDYGARMYSVLGRFVSADTIVPSPGDPQSLNRYSYTLGNPLKYRDPTGHDPYPLLDQAIKFFQGLGWTLVGNPQEQKSIYANGADAVFTQSGKALAVELKDVASGNVNLGTLGKSTGSVSDYGGSISRVVRSAERLAESSNTQLSLESQTILGARDAGTLGNALFTSAEGASEGAQAQFNGVFAGARNGIPNVLKALPVAGAALKQAASTQMLNTQVGVKMLVEDVKGAVSTLGNSALSAPIIVVPAFLIDPSSQYSPLNPCRQCSHFENN